MRKVPVRANWSRHDASSAKFSICRLASIGATVVAMDRASISLGIVTFGREAGRLAKREGAMVHKLGIPRVFRIGLAS